MNGASPDRAGNRPISALGATSPASWKDVQGFLELELQLNDEWQAALTVRLFRIGQWLFRAQQRSAPHRLAWKVWVLAERIWFHSLLGADLPPSLEVGAGVRFAHGARGVVFHPDVRIGARCTVYHLVTVGLRGTRTEVATIGDDVTLGAGCVVLGGVRIGDGGAVGPNAVVLSNVPARRHVVAPPVVELERELDLAETRSTARGRTVPRI